MTAKGDEVIRVEARTVAPAERVWAAWTDPARIAEWLQWGRRVADKMDPLKTCEFS